MAPGGQALYSDLVIEICLTLGMLCKQPLCQTQGLMHSIAKLLGVETMVPHFTTISRRGNGLRLPPKAVPQRAIPVHLVMDSTGLKIFSEGEWLEKNIKQSANSALGAIFTLILSAAKSLAPH